MTSAVSLRNLSRTFKDRKTAPRVAVDNLSMSLPAGQVHSLLGPNGAGKTTICRIISTVLLPTSGEAQVFGFDVVRQAKDVRQRLGIVFGGDQGLYGRLTAHENLMFWGALYGIPRRTASTRANHLLETFALTQRSRDTVQTFSRGMKQRLHLARGLLLDPPLLLLDEPTVGMDPVSAHSFRAIVRDLRAEGKTILLTTHDMDEAESISDTLTFINHGSIIGQGTPSAIRKQYGRPPNLIVRAIPANKMPYVCEILRPVVKEVHQLDSQTLKAFISPPLIGDAVAILASNGLLSVEIVPGSLEEIYVQLVSAPPTGKSDGFAR